MPEDEHATTPSMTLRTALRTSSNRAAVRLLEEVGIPQTVDYAKRLGVGLVPSVPSLALGSGEVTLEGMTAAYATFASAGIHRTPVVIRRVEDRDGQVIFETPDDATQVVSEHDRVSAVQHAQRRRQLRHRLEGAPRRLHAAGGRQDRHDQRLRRRLVRRLHAEAGGRACGLASTSRKTIIGGGYAGEIAVPLWGRFMKAATRGDRPEWFTTPKGLVGVTVCRISGKLPDDGLLRRRSRQRQPGRCRAARW